MINAIVCKFSKLCFGLQFTLIAFLFHFPQRCPSQLASLFSLKFLSLLRELASLISAPISSLCSWLHDHQACHFCLHVAPGNVVLWSQEMREGPGSNTFLMGLWSELKDELKVLNTVTARWHLIPFSLQGCSPTHFPSHAFPIQGFSDGLHLPETQCLLFILAALSQVPCTSPLQPKLLCIFLWLCYGCCPLYQTTWAGGSDELLRSAFESKAIIAPAAGNVTSLALSQLKRNAQYPHPRPTAPRPHSLSMTALHGGMKVWLSHLSGDRSEKSPLFGTPCGAGSGFPWGCFIFWLHQRMLSPANLPSLHGCYS